MQEILAFMHPLKNLNVWGDGGIITTNNKNIYEKLKLMRNHGLKNRDNCKIYGYNSRLDTIQAAVGLEMIKKINLITNERIKNAKYLNEKFSNFAIHLTEVNTNPVNYF